MRCRILDRRRDRPGCSGASSTDARLQPDADARGADELTVPVTDHRTPPRRATREPIRLSPPRAIIRRRPSRRSTVSRSTSIARVRPSVGRTAMPARVWRSRAIAFPARSGNVRFCQIPRREPQPDLVHVDHHPHVEVELALSVGLEAAGLIEGIPGRQAPNRPGREAPMEILQGGTHHDALRDRLHDRAAELEDLESLGARLASSAGHEPGRLEAPVGHANRPGPEADEGRGPQRRTGGRRALLVTSLKSNPLSCHPCRAARGPARPGSRRWPWRRRRPPRRRRPCRAPAGRPTRRLAAPGPRRAGPGGRGDGQNQQGRAQQPHAESLSGAPGGRTGTFRPSESS